MLSQKALLAFGEAPAARQGQHGYRQLLQSFGLIKRTSEDQGWALLITLRFSNVRSFLVPSALLLKTRPDPLLRLARLNKGVSLCLAS